MDRPGELAADVLTFFVFLLFIFSILAVVYMGGVLCFLISIVLGVLLLAELISMFRVKKKKR